MTQCFIFIRFGVFCLLFLKFSSIFPTIWTRVTCWLRVLFDTRVWKLKNISGSCGKLFYASGTWNILAEIFWWVCFFICSRFILRYNFLCQISKLKWERLARPLKIDLSVFVLSTNQNHLHIIHLCLNFRMLLVYWCDDLDRNKLNEKTLDVNSRERFLNSCPTEIYEFMKKLKAFIFIEWWLINDSDWEPSIENVWFSRFPCRFEQEQDKLEDFDPWKCSN